MDKVAIFGAGIIGQAIYALLKSDHQVICFFDNYVSTRSDFDSVPIVPLSKGIEFDKIYIAVMNQDAFCSIKKQLIDGGVSQDKIRSYKEVLLYRARIEFLYEYALKIRQQHNGLAQNAAAYANAEVGCFRGEFAKEINAAFAGCKLYLFDTFSGFEKNDIDLDVADQSVIRAFSERFAQTSEQLVRDNMPYPADLIIKKGYFPDTFDLVDQNFIFVSIDTDLYAPTKSACELFFPLLIWQGLLLVHDYYNEMLPGVKQAVDEFVRLTGGADFFPIGDAMSVAIIKRG